MRGTASAGAVAIGLTLLSGAVLAQPGGKTHREKPGTPATPATPAHSEPTSKSPDAAPESPEKKAAPARGPALHPMMVEVLYNVPTGMDGDANKDGVRHATGDEFVELVNPHDKAIQLLGYTLTDESQGDKSKIRFTFPALELKPGEVVVVFNGYGASWSGPVGDSKAAPAKKHPDFSDAYVFTMRVTNNRAAFNNSGDSVTLYSPANKAVQRVRWGTSAGGKLEEGVLDEIVPDVSKGSVQRIGVKAGDAWRQHSEIASTICSPGKYDVDVMSVPSVEGGREGKGEGSAPTGAKPESSKPESPKPDARKPGDSKPGDKNQKP